MSEELLHKLKTVPSDDKSENTLKMALGRILVPLLYTTGDIYKNDEAGEYPLLPSLMLLEELAQTEPGSGEAMKLGIEITRKRNFIADSLNRALKLFAGR